MDLYADLPVVGSAAGGGSAPTAPALSAAAAGEDPRTPLPGRDPRTLGAAAPAPRAAVRRSP